MKYLLYLTTILAGAAGCLAVPGDDHAPMCESNTDCDEQNGEICADGVCWGDPPAGTYAARIGPPGNRDGLVPTEITSVMINEDGWFSTRLGLEAPVTISGTVTLACSDAPCPPIASVITVSRPARIRGGPPFVAIAHTTEDSSAFSIPVPRAEPGEEYSVIVAPDRLNADRVNLDDAAPARVLVTPIDDVEGLAVGLGGGMGRTVAGTVLDSNGLTPLAEARVVVRGQWAPGGTTTEISSVASTDATGGFLLYLPSGTFDTTAEVVVTPAPDAYTLRPTLSVPLDLSTGAMTLSVDTLEVPDLGETQQLTVPIMGTSTMGVVQPVAGADVTLFAEKTFPRLPQPPLTARVEVTGTTLSNGQVQLRVLDSQELEYALTVQPPPQSDAAAYATIYGASVTIQPGASTLPQILLANQVSIRGVLYDHEGREAEGVVITIVPNALYAATLSDPLQRQLSGVVQTGSSTSSNGEFAVFVDPEIGGVPALYDVNFEPPQDSLLPSWQKQGLSVDRMNGLDLQDLELPPAAYVRSPVLDPADQPIEGAEVRLYEIPVAIGPCGENDPSPGCNLAAILRAQALSDGSGEVHLVLPDP
jgi:hypothetical protein